jgi:beta-lactamase class A
MLTLLRRSLDPAQLVADPENQVTGFLGAGLPATAKLWSKAGLMSRVRHDAAYIELPQSRPYLLVVFTEGREHSQNQALLPFISRQVVEAIAQL